MSSIYGSDLLAALQSAPARRHRGRVIIPPVVPPSGDKPAEGLILQNGAYGLQPLYQDTWHVGAHNPYDYLWNASYRGSRQNSIGPSSPRTAGNGLSFETLALGGAPLRTVLRGWIPPQTWWGWNSTEHIAGSPYKRGGIAVDVFIPADFQYTNNSGTPNGKTSIGFNIGPEDVNKLGAGSIWLNGDGGNTYVSQQNAIVGGLNFSVSGGQVYFKYYMHWLAQNGVMRPQSGAVGPNFAIPMGVWCTIELYVQMDTNALNGETRCWVNGEQKFHITGLDWGGMPGSRYGLNIASPGWTFRGQNARHMPGGTGTTDSTALRNQYWNKSNQFNNSFFYHNFRVLVG